jgi:hypothetical protein
MSQGRPQHPPLVCQKAVLILEHGVLTARQRSFFNNTIFKIIFKNNIIT